MTHGLHNMCCKAVIFQNVERKQGDDERSALIYFYQSDSACFLITLWPVRIPRSPLDSLHSSLIMHGCHKWELFPWNPLKENQKPLLVYQTLLNVCLNFLAHLKKLLLRIVLMYSKLYFFLSVESYFSIIHTIGGNINYFVMCCV